MEAIFRIFSFSIQITVFTQFLIFYNNSKSNGELRIFVVIKQFVISGIIQISRKSRSSFPPKTIENRNPLTFFCSCRPCRARCVCRQRRLPSSRRKNKRENGKQLDAPNSRDESEQLTGGGAFGARFYRVGDGRVRPCCSSSRSLQRGRKSDAGLTG